MRRNNSMKNLTLIFPSEENTGERRNRNSSHLERSSVVRCPTRLISGEPVNSEHGLHSRRRSSSSYDDIFSENSPGIPLTLEEQFQLPLSPPPVVQPHNKKALRIVEWSRSTEMVNCDARATQSDHDCVPSLANTATDLRYEHKASRSCEVLSSPCKRPIDAMSEEDVNIRREDCPSEMNEKENQSLDELDPLDCIAPNKMVESTPEEGSGVQSTSASLEQTCSESSKDMDLDTSEDSVTSLNGQVADEENPETKNLPDRLPLEIDYSASTSSAPVFEVEDSSDNGVTDRSPSPNNNQQESMEEQPYLIQLQREMEQRNLEMQISTDGIDVMQTDGADADTPPGTPFLSDNITLDMMFFEAEKRRTTNLPSINEEESEDPWRRPGVSTHHSAPSLEVVNAGERYEEKDVALPMEPSELAPGMMLRSRDTSTDSVPDSPFLQQPGSLFQNPPLHRRAISDHLPQLPRQREMEDAVPRVEIRQRPKSTRSTVANRCQSQLLHQRKTSHDERISPSRSEGMDRNQSTSDPSINDERRNGASSTELEPPPVVLPRKAASRQSWKQHMPSFSTPHNVMSPSLISIQSRNTAPSATSPPVVEPLVSPAEVNTCTISPACGVNVKKKAVKSTSCIPETEPDPIPPIRKRLASLSELLPSPVIEPTDGPPPPLFRRGFLSQRHRSSDKIEAPRRELPASPLVRSASSGGVVSVVRRSLRLFTPRSNERNVAVAASRKITVDALPRKLASASLDEVDEDDIADDLVALHRTLSTSAAARRRDSAREEKRLKPRPGDRFRVEKKKEKSNIFDTFFSDRKKKKERAGLGGIGFMANVAGARSGSAPIELRRSTVSESTLVTSAKTFYQKSEGLPDHLSFLSTAHSEPAAGAVEEVEAPRLQLDRPQWARFNLFEDEEYQTWSKKFRFDHLSAKEILRQDKIYELITSEKKHCANLVFLKQAYRQRFVDDINEHGLLQADIDQLVPDVLDAMLQFHLHLLERLRQRQKEAEQVPTISDVICSELSESGPFSTIAVQAYTTFGLQKEESEKYFDKLKKQAAFRMYLEKVLSSDKMYVKYEKFKTLLTKVMAHSTRYHMILEDIRKNDPDERRKVENQTAVDTAKMFALRIDRSLSVSQMTRKWEAIRREIDWSTKTMLATSDASRPLVDFHMSDLKWDTSADGSERRKIICIGDVVMKNNGEKIVGDTSCLLILFDDILVFLQRKQHKITFFPQKQAVFAVHSLHARAMERGWSAHILVSSFKPMLMEVQFPNKSDRAKWMSMFESAIQRAPRQVRMVVRKEDAKDLEQEEKRQRQAEDEWMKKLDKLFDERKGAESAVADYIEKRMDWFDKLRGHLVDMPYKERSDIPEKVKASVKQRFKELRQARVEPICKLVSKCTTARDQDLMDFFDDAAEINNADSDSGSGSDSSGSDSKNLPRRVQTFHGTTTPKREKGSFRRHTTVPKMHTLPNHTTSLSSTMSAATSTSAAVEEEVGSDDGEDTEDEEMRRQHEETTRMRQKLPLSMNLKSRRAATHLIKENVSLRTEIMHLKNDLAQNKTRLSLLERSRCVPGGQLVGGPAVPPSETLEALRRKEQELRESETRLKQREDEVKEMEKKIETMRQTEEEIENRWKVLLSREAALGSPTTSAPSIGTPERRVQMVPPTSAMVAPTRRDPGTVITPALKNLSEKVQTKKKK